MSHSGPDLVCSEAIRMNNHAKEGYYENNLDEQHQHEQAKNSSDVQIIETKTPNPEASRKEGKRTKGGK